MLKAEPIIALAQRLAQRARKTGGQEAASDYKLAAFYLKKLASLVVADEAKATSDIKRKRELEYEAAQLFTEAGNA